MKTVLAIIGSPRKLGNCEVAVKAVSRSIPESHELKLLRLSDFDIHPCRGCYSCLFNEGVCVIRDHLPLIWDALFAADAIIVAAPAYFLGPNASLKRLLDRGLSLFPHVEKLWGKPAVGIGIAGIPDKEGYTRLGIQSFLSLMMADIKGCEILYGALPGEVFLKEGNAQILSGLGAALFGGGASEKEPACPVCGGDTFRFMGDDRVRCMLCSNPGIFRISENRISFGISPGDHEMFLSKEAAVRHREWLKGMKTQFLQKKAQLKEVGITFLKDGAWIKPPEKAGT